MKFSVPKLILDFLSGAEVSRDKIGESPAKVYRIEKKNDLFFLKISKKIYSPTTFSVTREARVLEWLNGKVNVPELIIHAENAKWECMITRGVPGRPLYRFLKERTLVVDAFCAAIRCMHQVLVQGCPFDSGVEHRLAELEYLLEKDLVATDVSFDAYSDIKSKSDLLNYLRSNQVQEDTVFSHGDLGDSNILLDEKDNLHFIDLGRGGLADRWVDISFSYRNLNEELSLEDAEVFVKKLGTLDQPAKRKYFELLDELF